MILENFKKYFDLRFSKSEILREFSLQKEVAIFEFSDFENMRSFFVLLKFSKIMNFHFCEIFFFQIASEFQCKHEK